LDRYIFKLQKELKYVSFDGIVVLLILENVIIVIVQIRISLRYSQNNSQGVRLRRKFWNTQS